MQHKSLLGLIVLNAVLLVALIVVAVTPQPAQAQLGGRRAGDYVMVAAQRRGQTYSTVWVTDLNNGAILAVDPQPRQQLKVVAFRPLARDVEASRKPR